ncbi:hypothetical protein [Streptomyces sp. NPDC014995]|uniref:hypothetical protein n=1 Tax=Streptomyces sp. NPDC014995 TaxID=3364936 RepID=UPI0036F5DF75
MTVSGAAAATTKKTMSATPSEARWRRPVGSDPAATAGCWGAVEVWGSVMEVSA